MKTIKLLSGLLIITALALTLNSCWDSIGCENGSGTIINQNRDLQNFTRIELEGIGNVYIQQSDAESVTIETDDNIMPYILTSNSHGTLHISSERSICPKKLNIYVNVKDLNSVVIAGSGDIYVNNNLSVNTIDFTIEGSGDIRVNNINAEKINLNIDGSGDVKLGGKAYSLNAKVSGSGDINALELNSSDVVAEIDGSGDIKVTAIERLYGIINGSGDIYYKGNPPQFRTIVNGSGDIRKL